MSFWCSDCGEPQGDGRGSERCATCGAQDWHNDRTRANKRRIARAIGREMGGAQLPSTGDRALADLAYKAGAAIMRGGEGPSAGEVLAAFVVKAAELGIAPAIEAVEGVRREREAPAGGAAVYVLGFNEEIAGDATKEITATSLRTFIMRKVLVAKESAPHFVIDKLEWGDKDRREKLGHWSDPRWGLVVKGEPVILVVHNRSSSPQRFVASAIGDLEEDPSSTPAAAEESP